MTAVRLRESVAYGARLYGYLLVVTLLGGAILALGGVLLLPEYQAWSGAGGADVTNAAAGVLLAVTGLSLLVVTYVGVWYKAIADAVATGNAHADGGAWTATGESAAGTAGADGSRGDDASAGDESAGERIDDATDVAGDVAARAGEAETTAAPSVEPAETSEPTADGASAKGGQRQGGTVTSDGSSPGSQEPNTGEGVGSREFSPEEIAFGTSGDEEASADEWTDEPAESPDSGGEPAEYGTAEPVEPAGRNASGDPLADPFDDE